MVFATETSELPRIEIKPEALARLPFGVASPLWGFYASAALSGVAYWWMTQWTRPVNLEALFGQAAATAQPVVDVVDAVTGTVVEALAPPDLPAAADHRAVVAQIVDAMCDGRRELAFSLKERTLVAR